MCRIDCCNSWLVRGAARPLAPTTDDDSVRLIVVTFVVGFDDGSVGYRWGQIVNRHGVCFAALGSYDRYILVIKLLNLS